MIRLHKNKNIYFSSPPLEGVGTTGFQPVVTRGRLSPSQLLELVTAVKIAGVNLVFYVRKFIAQAVCNYNIAGLFKFIKILEYL